MMNNVYSSTMWSQPPVTPNFFDHGASLPLALQDIRSTASMNSNIPPVTAKMSNLSKRLGFGANMLRNNYNGGYNDFNQNRPYNGPNYNPTHYELENNLKTGMKRPCVENGANNAHVGLPFKRLESDHRIHSLDSSISVSEMNKWENSTASAGTAAALHASAKAPEVTCADFDLGLFDFDDMNSSAPASQGE